MKIYVITKGEYSDYHICAVATEKDKAVVLQKRFSDTYENAEIEEYDTDYHSEMLKYDGLYRVTFREKESLIATNVIPDFVERESFSPKKCKDGSIQIHVFANNEIDAVKFASDKIAKYRAENMGL